MDSVKGADALIIGTEWQVFRSPGFETVKDLLKHPVIFDSRNLYEPNLMREAGFEYFPMGRTG